MKEVIAIIRPGQWQKTKAALHEEGFTAFTVSSVLGRGKEKGLRYLTSQGQGGIHYLPKQMVTIFTEAENVERIVQIIVDTNKTGEIGDGKIFVCPVEGMESIRTGNNNEMEAVV